MKDQIQQQLKKLAEALNEARKETVIAETNLESCRATENNIRGQLNAYQFMLSQAQEVETKEEEKNIPPPSGKVVAMPKTEEEPPNES